MIDWDSCVLWLDSKYFAESRWWDRSKYLNNATNYDAAWQNDSFYFDASNSYFKCLSNDSLDITDKLSIELLVWFNVSDSTYRRVLCHGIATSAGYQITIKNRRITLSKCNSTDYNNGVQKQTVNQITLKTWYHIIGIYDEGTFNIYINGVNQSLQDDVKLGYGSGSDLLIGKRSDGYYFGGKLKLLRIYSDVLNANQVQVLYDVVYRRI